jgi:hypothetical protein
MLLFSTLFIQTCVCVCVPESVLINSFLSHTKRTYSVAGRVRFVFVQYHKRQRHHRGQAGEREFHLHQGKRLQSKHPATPARKGERAKAIISRAQTRASSSSDDKLLA